MPPNFDVPPPIDHHSFEDDQKENPPQTDNRNNGNFLLEVFQSSVILLVNILIGIVVGVSFIFSLRSFPLTATPLHVVLCVTGYQLLMSQAILSLSDSNGWSLRLSLVQKRRAHWILQLAGSVLAIAGSIVKIIDKSVHFNTYHGQFALVALVFTSVSLLNGLTSLYAYELRGVLPGNVSKISHICFGTIAFISANICLCVAFVKPAFQNWSTVGFGNALIGITATLTFIIIINPLLTFLKRIKSAVQVDSN